MPALSGNPVVDYDAIRAEASGLFADKVKDVRAYVTRLQKAQRAAEQELDRCHASCVFAACFMRTPLVLMLSAFFSWH